MTHMVICPNLPSLIFAREGMTPFPLAGWPFVDVSSCVGQCKAHRYKEQPEKAMPTAWSTVQMRRGRMPEPLQELAAPGSRSTSLEGREAAPGSRSTSLVAPGSRSTSLEGREARHLSHARIKTCEISYQTLSYRVHQQKPDAQNINSKKSISQHIFIFLPFPFPSSLLPFHLHSSLIVLLMKI